MSKHPSNTTKQNLLRRGLAGLLSLALLLGLLPSTIFTAHAASWADPYVQTLTDWGVMRGDIGGNMNPNRNITRAEFVTMMNRAYGYSKLAGHPFTDVRTTDWYDEDIDIGYNIGYFKGTSSTTASPNASLTREQAAVLLARNMMLQPTVGETLGFSDTRTLSEWSRGLVGAAAANGIISGYEDGSFQPSRNITRGEVAAMLVRAIGTPIQSPGSHALGNVYGNVTVNTAGVQLRDGVIAGNLYLTGGIDLGEVLLENVTVLGEIIVSGGGESNSSESSVIMRNVVADNLVVDSIGSQFVTIRAEGNTDIPTTTVRTNAYVDDSSLPGYGLSYIELDGDNGALLQLAGNVKEVWNKTPGSSLQVVQGSADKVTIDENATGSSVLVDGDARVDHLNLDVATNVTGTGDIKNLNVGAAGSTVEQLPDSIIIRPGITTDIAGGNMNSSQAAESSADPKLLAGYPAVRSIAPTSAQIVFRTNKPGTIYWAVSAVADGSVSETDLLNPPVYGNKIVASGTVTAAAANTDYTAAVSRLTRAGSYYVTAMLVDGRNQHSPIKVTSFSTPDDTVPAFATGYPVITKNTCEDAQVTVMTTKSCLLYYALLPNGAAAPTAADFKSAAIPGNLGYGTMSVTKNVTTPIHINSTPLEEETTYVLYLWLTDHDGAKSSTVRSLRFTTPDETPPTVTSIQQGKEGATTIPITFTIDEPGNLVWALVKEDDHLSGDEGNYGTFLNYVKETFLDNDTERSKLEFVDDAALATAKVRLENATGVVASGSASTGRTGTSGSFTINVPRDVVATTSSFVLYYMADDNATATGNLSEEIKAYRVHTLDVTPPTVTQHFTSYNGDDDTKNPKTNTGVRLVFSESIQSGAGKTKVFYSMYRNVVTAREALEANPSSDTLKAAYENARTALGDELARVITLYQKVNGRFVAVTPRTSQNQATLTNWVVDFRNAQVKPGNNGTYEVILPNAADLEKASEPDSLGYRTSALNLNSGTAYYFHVGGENTNSSIFDLASTPNRMIPVDLPEFTTALARVNLSAGDGETRSIRTATDPLTGNSVDFSADPNKANNNPQRIDFLFQMTPEDVESMDSRLYWDMILWFDSNIDFTLYYRPINEQGMPIKSDGTAYSQEEAPNAPWTLERTQNGTGDDHLFITKNHYKSYIQNYRTPAGATEIPYERVKNMLDCINADNTKTLPKRELKEYAIHINSVDLNVNEAAWRNNINLRVAVIAGSGGNDQLPTLREGTLNSKTDPVVSASSGMTAIEYEQPFTMEKNVQSTRPPQIQSVTLDDRSDKDIDLTVIMDQVGTLYYMAIPLRIYNSSMVEIGGPNGAQLLESDLYNITGNAITDPTDSTNEVADNTNPARYASTVVLSVDKKSATNLTVPQAMPDLKNIPLMRQDENRLSGSTYPDTVGKQVYLPNQVQFNNTQSYQATIEGFASGSYGPSNGDFDPMPFKIPGLKANTAYVLVLAAVPAGSSPSESTTFLAYRFTTNQYDIPKLFLSSLDKVNITAREMEGDEAYVEYIVINKGSEANIINNGLTLNDDFETGANGLAKDTFDQYYTGNNASAKPKTVLDAMLTLVYDNEDKFLGTAFDLFAKDEIKPRYANLIRNASDQAGSSETGNNIAWGEVGDAARRMNPSVILALGDHIKAGQQYTIVAMAKRDRATTNNNYAFCAWNTVEKDDGTPPMLTSAYQDGEVAQMPGQGADPKNVGIQSADLILTFSSALHCWNPGASKAVPICNCKRNASGHTSNILPLNGTFDTATHYSIGYAVNGSTASTTSLTFDVVGDDSHNASTAPIGSIRLRISQLKGNSTATINLFGPSGQNSPYERITDEKGNGSERRAVLTIRVRAVNTGTEENPFWEPEIIGGPLVSTSTTLGWVEAGSSWNGTLHGN